MKFRKTKYLLVGIFIAVVGLLIYLWRQQPQPEEIPPEYQTLYTELEQKLDQFNQQLAVYEEREKGNPVFAAEFLAANGNRGRALLKEEDYPYILKYLDALQLLGVAGVKISINYPLLVSDFPNSEKYLEFYQKLSHEIKEKRKLKLLIQATAMFTQAEFTDPTLASREYYQNLTLEKYTQGKREQLEKIIAVIKPDYLTVETEPDTMAHLTGLTQLNNPENYRQAVEKQISGLKKEGVLLGAGVGTWNEQKFVEELVKIPELDFLELRIYPIVNDYLSRAVEYSQLAHAANKKVIFGESWLFKASEKEVNSGEAGGPTVAKIFKRDTYSFWQPLDEKFLRILVKLAHRQRIEFVSPFWSHYFFAYLDYSPRFEKKDSGEILKTAAKKAVKNVQKGKFSQTGIRYKNLISE